MYPLIHVTCTERILSNFTPTYYNRSLLYQTRHSGHVKSNAHSLLQRPPRENAPAQPVSIIILEYCMYQAVLHNLGENKQHPEKFSRSLY